MPYTPTPDFGHLVVNRGDPKGQTVLPAPRRAQVTTRLYNGQTVTLELDVVARAQGLVCVSQERPGRGPWRAWIPAADARPV